MSTPIGDKGQTVSVYLKLSSIVSGAGPHPWHIQHSHKYSPNPLLLHSCILHQNYHFIIWATASSTHFFLSMNDDSFEQNQDDQVQGIGPIMLPLWCPVSPQPFPALFSPMLSHIKPRQELQPSPPYRLFPSSTQSSKTSTICPICYLPRK